ncbi:LADA_0F05270g1_1 [Lachancea dasiensis]|uniref:2,5-diamino-6-ribosylamino-4(3H)-pyrimidinone 5'-phosphate reductase n=1 Tax=Lachancea dasiensis TaxID=1072105 RepID=A0A1G4JJC6_9SACH|nr:LADA_0F05270g1_1 [Lachancea dasiensis]
MSLLPIRADLLPFLEDYLPPREAPTPDVKPFVTLTYAQSLDSRISKGRGQRTVISHFETKTMTHYLRYHHDGILVGAGTALADNPGLNCQWSPEDTIPNAKCSPRPIIIDPRCTWHYEGSKMQRLQLQGSGKPPIVVVKKKPPQSKITDSKVVYFEAPLNSNKHFDWLALVRALKREFGINSIMVEGGAVVINELLARPDVVDSLIVTIGATYLGEQGVGVSPPSGEVTLTYVDWWKGTLDSVMAARLLRRA